MDLSGFANPWEHVRLLSDRTRNDRLVDLLVRRAPGARVVEVGCGTGLLSCIAARAGAEKVYAVEPTPLWELAASLVEANGLSDRVEVLEGRVQDLEPRPVDLAFSELLNADPFLEEVVEAMDAVRPWVVEGGMLAPHRLRVWVALVRAGGSAKEVRSAQSELNRLADRFDLDLAELRVALDPAEPYRYLSTVEDPISAPALLYDLPLGSGVQPDELVQVEVEVTEPGPCAGAIVWFEATYDDALTIGNAPGPENHWGQLVCAFGQERGVRMGERVALTVDVDDHELEVRLS